MSSLNGEIKAAIDESDIAHARQLLRDALKEADGETYYLASVVAVDNEQKIEFLEKAIGLDPFHEESRKALKVFKNGVSAKAPPTLAPSHPVATPVQPQQTTEQPLVLPLAQVQGDGIVYTIPHSRGTKRTTLPTGTTVEVLERDAKNNWINVTFMNSVGQRTFGWMSRDSLGEITFNGRSASANDLRISELEFNTRSELQYFAKIIGTPPEILYGFAALLLLFSIGLIGFMILIALSLNGSNLWALLPFIGGGITGFILGLLLIKLANERRSVPVSSFNLNQVNNTKMSKMSTTELIIEQQQKTLLWNIAGSMATRLVPNNINVKHR